MVAFYTRHTIIKPIFKYINSATGRFLPVALLILLLLVLFFKTIGIKDPEGIFYSYFSCISVFLCCVFRLLLLLILLILLELFFKTLGIKDP